LYRRNIRGQQAAEEAINAIPTTPMAMPYGRTLIYGNRKKGFKIASYRSAIRPYFYDYHRGQAYYVWGVLTSAQDPIASRQRFEEAETHLREALRKNDNFRPARSYLVAVLSELGRQDEAVKEMNISLEKGEPLAKLLKSGDKKLADEHIRTLTPYKNQEIRKRLAKAWQEAAR
jgi:tetratricopeptide (TPR) repeat protein